MIVFMPNLDPMPPDVRDDTTRQFIKARRYGHALIALAIMRQRSTSAGLAKLVGSVAGALVVLRGAGIL